MRFISRIVTNSWIVARVLSKIVGYMIASYGVRITSPFFYVQ